MERKYYEAYDDRYKVIHLEGDSWAEEMPSECLLEFLTKYNINKNSSILEIGCGEGQNALYLMKKGLNIKASDVSYEAINWCKNKAKVNGFNPDSFFVLDALNNKLSEKFDCIYTVSTLHMLVPNDDRQKFLDFIYNHIKDDGIAIITVMGDGNRVYNDSDITKAFEPSKRNFKDREVVVASTTCKIVNWDTFYKELECSKLKVIESFVSEDIVGFDKSMIAIVCK